MKDELTEQKAIRYAKYSVLVAGILIFVVLFLVFFLFKFCLLCGTPNYTIAESGQFGDTFNGILGPIIAACAAVLTFLAFYIQYEANKIQRKGQSVQQFDSTFFNLISNHYQIINGIEEKWRYEMDDEVDKDEIIKGRELFKKVAWAVKDVFEKDTDLTGPRMLYRAGGEAKKNIDKKRPLFALQLEYFDVQKDGEKLNRIFYHFFAQYRSAFSHYFRNLYHIFKFIIEFRGFDGLYNLSEQTQLKEKYIKIVVAQLSTYELILLWYNGRMNFGKKFEKIIREHELLANIDFDAEIVLPELLIRDHPYLKD